MQESKLNYFTYNMQSISATPVYILPTSKTLNSEDGWMAGSINSHCPYL